MDRTSAPGYVTVGGIRQWINKNLAGGVPGTQVDQVFMNDLQEELVEGLITAAGLTPTAGVQNQVKAATDFFYAWKNAPLAANYTVTSADRGKIFDCATGCNVITLPKSESQDAGFTVGFSGLFNTTTINLHSGDTDDGAGPLQNTSSSITIGLGDYVVLQARGTAWGILASNLTTLRARGQAVFTAGSGNWTCPNGVWVIDVTLTGGGGDGASSSATSLPGAVSGGGGGAGATAKFLAAVIPGTSYAYSVGAATSSSAFLGLTAGQGGNAAPISSSSAGGTGGIVTGSVAGLMGTLLSIPGGYGSDGQFNNAFIFAGNGGASFWGGGGRAGNGGGELGQAFGAGGGGAYSTGTGGVGAGGVLVIKW